MDTPLFKNKQVAIPNGVNLFVNLEYMNPGVSIKDRLGIKPIRDSIDNGQLKPVGTVIEPTAGNTDIGLALVAIGLDITVFFTVSK